MTTSPVKGQENYRVDPPLCDDNKIVARHITFERKERREEDGGGLRKLGPDDDDKIFYEIVYSRSTSRDKNGTEQLEDINSPPSCGECIERAKTEADLKDQLQQVVTKQAGYDDLLEASWNTMKTLKTIINEARDPNPTNKLDKKTILEMFDSELQKLTNLKAQIEGGYSNLKDLKKHDNEKLKHEIEQLNQHLDAIKREKSTLGLKLEKTQHELKTEREQHKDEIESITKNHESTVEKMLDDHKQDLMSHRDEIKEIHKRLILVN